MSAPLALSMGDPAGIGPEICAKALAEDGRAADVIVYGDPSSLQRCIDQLELSLSVNLIDDVHARAGTPGVVDVRAVGTGEAVQLGVVSPEAGAAAASFITAAVQDILAGDARALITAPINKESLSAAGVPFPGHTEMLASLAGVQDVSMMLYNDQLRVVLVSVHVPLREAVQMVTHDRVLRTIRMAHAAGAPLGVARPRVAVAGLNPHAGEGGLFGDEEAAAITPAIAAAVMEGIDATGPWPGDTVFMSAREGRFDLVVAQYHDQGLIPIKYLGLDEGVNVTLGLPFVRTSVDHGTAFDIAGQGRASAASLLTAIDAADRLSAHHATSVDAQQA